MFNILAHAQSVVDAAVGQIIAAPFSIVAHASALMLPDATEAVQTDDSGESVKSSAKRKQKAGGVKVIQQAWNASCEDSAVSGVLTTTCCPKECLRNDASLKSVQSERKIHRTETAAERRKMCRSYFAGHHYGDGTEEYPMVFWFTLPNPRSAEERCCEVAWRAVHNFTATFLRDRKKEVQKGYLCDDPNIGGKRQKGVSSCSLPSSSSSSSSPFSASVVEVDHDACSTAEMLCHIWFGELITAEDAQPNARRMAGSVQIEKIDIKDLYDEYTECMLDDDDGAPRASSAADVLDQHASL